MNDVILNKKVSIERCIRQIGQYYSRSSDLPFEEDYLKQDAIGMNLQRACDLAIDIANHLIKTKKLGLPQDSKDSFALLRQAGIISEKQTKTLQAMIGFRNILVHEYKRLDLNIMAAVIERDVYELLDFANTALNAAG
jgi:uncharacterized protein YutE (UPF0331/DUF86 family)